MRIITLEEHFSDPHIMAANNAFNKNQPPLSPERAKAMKLLMSRAFPGDELFDVDAKRLAFMDANRIDMQVLSCSSPVSDLAPAEEAVRICQQINNMTRRHIDAHPDRFAGFATLPVADPEAGVVRRIGPDPHGVPSIELSDSVDGRCYALIIFTDEKHAKEIEEKTAVGEIAVCIANFMRAREPYGAVMKKSKIVK